MLRVQCNYLSNFALNLKNIVFAIVLVVSILLTLSIFIMGRCLK